MLCSDVWPQGGICMFQAQMYCVLFAYNDLFSQQGLHVKCIFSFTKWHIYIRSRFPHPKSCDTSFRIQDSLVEFITNSVTMTMMWVLPTLQGRFFARVQSNHTGKTKQLQKYNAQMALVSLMTWRKCYTLKSKTFIANNHKGIAF